MRAVFISNVGAKIIGAQGNPFGNIAFIKSCFSKRNQTILVLRC